MGYHELGYDPVETVCKMRDELDVLRSAAKNLIESVNEHHLITIQEWTAYSELREAVSRSGSAS
jgi:hypothetical protein